MNAAALAAIAANTVREAVRHRVLYTLLFFAIGLIGTGLLLSTLSYVERERILQDVGLAAIRLFGAAIAIFVGVGLIHREVERRTVYTILSKPVSRSAFLLGKYAGLVATLWLMLAVMGLCFAGVSLLAGAPLDSGHAAALLLAGAEFAVLVAVATLFSAFTTTMLASLFSAGLYLIGHLTRNLRELMEVSGSPVAAQATAWLHRLLPDLEVFNRSLEAVHGLPIGAGEVLWSLLYAFGWCASLLFVATLVFERRDFR